MKYIYNISWNYFVNILSCAPFGNWRTQKWAHTHTHTVARTHIPNVAVFLTLIPVPHFKQEGEEPPVVRATISSSSWTYLNLLLPNGNYRYRIIKISF